MIIQMSMILQDSGSRGIASRRAGMTENLVWFLQRFAGNGRSRLERGKRMMTTLTRLAGIALALTFLTVLVLSAERTAAKAPAPTALEINQSYAQRATWFIDRTLEGQYAAALQVGSDRFRRDIGETGLRYFRDSMAKYGKGRFVPTTAGAEEGYFIVAGVLEFPGGRRMDVHVIFKGDKVEHLYQRWA